MDEGQPKHSVCSSWVSMGESVLSSFSPISQGQVGCLGEGEKEAELST